MISPMNLRAAIALSAVGTLMVGCGSNSSSSTSGASRNGSVRLGTALTRTPGLQSSATPGTKGDLPPSTLGTADIQATIDAHNAWRARYNEQPLAWDAGLASLAQDWSNQMAQTGNFDHRPNNNEGENIFSGTGTYVPKDVVDAWGNEVSSFHADTNTCDANAQCGHFTQVVWASTAKVGCGSAAGAGGTIYWTCNYDPPGNYTGIGPFDLAAQQQAARGQ